MRKSSRKLNNYDIPELSWGCDLPQKNFWKHFPTCEEHKDPHHQWSCWIGSSWTRSSYVTSTPDIKPLALASVDISGAGKKHSGLLEEVLLEKLQGKAKRAFSTLFIPAPGRIRLFAIDVLPRIMWTAAAYVLETTTLTSHNELQNTPHLLDHSEHTYQCNYPLEGAGMQFLPPFTCQVSKRDIADSSCQLPFGKEALCWDICAITCYLILTPGINQVKAWSTNAHMLVHTEGFDRSNRILHGVGFHQKAYFLRSVWNKLQPLFQRFTASKICIKVVLNGAKKRLKQNSDGEGR